MSEYNGVVPPSLQPWTNRPATTSKSFGSVLGRIYAERGHFRNITEAALREEITTQAIAGPPSPDQSGPSSPVDHSQDSSKDDIKARTEKLQAARRTVIEHVASAQNEALLALDFVSLLLTKDMPAAESSMSPFLKQSVPRGTLGIDMWAGMEPDAKTEETDRLLARGKRVQVLGESADALFKAGDRLRNTVEKEKKYWNELLNVKEAGWSISRLPRERGGLGVRYGFGEAQGEFRARGLAALRMGEDGDIVLDRGLGMSSRRLRVREIRRGKVVGQSFATRNDTEDLDIGGRIRLARDSLFEEELWHEAMLEARELGSYGVGLRDDAIVLPLPNASETGRGSDEAGETAIEVSLVDAIESTGTSASEGQLSSSVAILLRLGLSNTHRSRLKHRSALPAPLSSTKPQKQTAQIMSPVLAMLAHHSSVAQLQAGIASLVDVLGSAGIQASFSRVHPFASVLQDVASADKLFARFNKPFVDTSDLTIDMRGKDDGAAADELHVSKLAVTTSTTLEAPSFGTRFVVSCAGNPDYNRSCSDTTALVDHLAFVVQGMLTRALAAKHFPDWDITWRTGRLTRPMRLGASDGARSLCCTIAKTVRREQQSSGAVWTIQLAAGEKVSRWPNQMPEGAGEGFWQMAKRLADH